MKFKTIDVIGDLNDRIREWRAEAIALPTASNGWTESEFKARVDRARKLNRMLDHAKALVDDLATEKAANAPA